MTTTADRILARARTTRDRINDSYTPIDYDRMKREFPKQKARLTRALNEGNEDIRQEKVVLACHDAVKVWDEIGAWPDDWSRWQRALSDVMPWNDPIRLEDLR